MTDKQTTADGHLHHWRGARRQSLREQIKAEKLILAAERIRVKAERRAKEMTANEVGALKLSLDALRTQLAKVLPDVKAVEHDPGEHTEKLARDQLNARLTELYAAASSRLNGSGGGGIIKAPEGGTTTH